jgi:predicted ribosome quality control (RQC) complex YloA/Tae2 family protein
LDGLLMGFLARELNSLLTGGRVDRVAQPDDDLLILHIRNGGANHRLLICASPGYTRLHLSGKTYENPAEAPMFCMLLRKHLLGARLIMIEQLFGDRLLALRFLAADELGDLKEKTLWFEAMGKHSNLTLEEDGRILDAMRHVSHEMSRVRQMLPGLPFVMPPRQDKLTPEEVDEEAIFERLQAATGPLDRFLARAISGLNDLSAEEIAQRAAGDAETQLAEADKRALAKDLAELLKSLPALADPTLLTDQDGLPDSVLPFPYRCRPGEVQQRQPSLSQALETLYFQRDMAQRLGQKAAGLRKAIKNAQERTEKKLAKLDEEILSEEQAEELRIAGELLTANLHGIQKGQEQITLQNYYTGGELTLPLDKTVSPAANAQRFFKRYRKAHTARKLAGEQGEKALEELNELEEAAYFAQRAENAVDLSEIRGSLAEKGLLRREIRTKTKKKEAPSRPKRFTSKEGFLIQAGRSALQNEALLKNAQPDDVWLHTRDVPGSHVLITAGGKAVPEGTLLLAAKIASFYSKAGGAAVRVDYTLRKFVKKTPGGAPGLVHYSGERGLTVSAGEDEVKEAETKG